MDSKKIINKLIRNASHIDKADSFEAKPGVYAFFFNGKEFLLSNYKPKKNEIIYLGKTQSSGISRVLKTHFGTGNTGSSTVRRTVGALLREKLKLAPIPRNNTDLGRNKMIFKFEERSEIRLTKWMRDNLLVSFVPLLEKDVPTTEKLIIKTLNPVLNIEGNSNGQFYKLLKESRKECAKIAFNKPQKKHTAAKKREPKFENKLENTFSEDFKLSSETGCVNPFGCLGTIIKWVIIATLVVMILQYVLD